MDQLPTLFYNLTMRLFDAVGTTVKNGPPIRSVFISSARGREGKTFMAKKLAAYLANVSNEKILLVDGNFQNPALHDEPGTANGFGFSDCLASGEYARAELHATPFPNLMLLPAGQSCRPGLLFRPQAIQEFFAQMANRFTMVLIDGGTTDTSGCMPHVSSGIILVVDALNTRREVVQGAMARMNVDRSKYYGVILNKKAQYIPQSLYKHF